MVRVANRDISKRKKHHYQRVRAVVRKLAVYFDFKRVGIRKKIVTMPPKRKQATEFSAKRGKKSRVIEPAAKCNKMAAQQMNVADLQVLLQTALANHGDTFDPTGYAYMSVASGSNYAEFESQDPLAEFQADHDPDQDASDGEETESRSGTENETSVHGGRASNFFDTLLLKPTPNRSTDTGSGAGAAETASSSMFLQDLPFHLAVEEGESVSGVSKQTVAEIYPTNQDAQSENNVLESCELVAHELGVEEIRAMLEAALKRQMAEKNKMRHIEETNVTKKSQEPMSPEMPLTNIQARSSIHTRENHTQPPASQLPVPTAGNTGRTNSIPAINIQNPQNGKQHDSQRVFDQDSPQFNDDRCLDSSQPRVVQNRSPLVAKNTNPLSIPSSAQIEVQKDTACQVVDIEHHNWEQKYHLLEKRYNELLARHKKLKQKFSNLEQEKLSSDDYGLRLGKELMQLKDKQKVPQVHFTEADGIAITTNELEELNARAGNDSLFVGLLVTRLIGPARLANMSVTGQASRRFMNLKNPDGSLVHPASEKIDPNIIEFVCDKVAERTAIRIGPDNMATIRRHSDVTLIRKYICQKIANLRKAAEVRKSRGIVEGSGQDAGNIRV